MTLTFSLAVASLERPDRQSPHLLNSAAHFFHCTTYTRRILPNCFHKVFMNYLGRHSVLTEVLDNRSDFKLLHFEIVLHPPLLKVLTISDQAWLHAFHFPNVLQLDQMTD